MKISKADLVKLIVESNNQGYNLAVKHADRNYDEHAADFREAQTRLRDEYEEDLAEAERRASSIEARAEERAAEAYEVGRREALSDEALASAKSQAYEAGYAKAQEEAHKVGYQRGLAEGRDRAENTYETGLEAGVKAERERAEAQEPKLSVWFMPIGSGPALGYPPGIDKIKAIKAIRRAYGTGEGYSLKDVKDLAESKLGTFVSCGEPLPQSKAAELYLQLQAAGFEVVLRKP